MQIDIEHVLFWMDAIRNSEDKTRTLESFWKGQIRSKLWLIENLKSFVRDDVTIDIHGGWNGVLASLLFQNIKNIKSIRSIDIDPKCEEIANTINKIEHINGKFCAITSDMCDIDIDADIVINTSCEHITQQQYDKWLHNIPDASLIVLQSNNYYIDEHVRIANDLSEFSRQSHLKKEFFVDSLTLPLYERFMIVGKKDV
jgi:hypothetical protein